MSQTAADAFYREAASTLTPRAVSEYLALSPWALERRDENKEIWQLIGPEGKAIGRIMLPLATDYVDFEERFYDALIALARINNWNADELQDQILATKADLFFVRLDQPTTDGTIPIRQAEVTIEAIYKMLRSTAATVANARNAKKGQLPAAATNFLEDDVRLGHTKPGSFVFTVVARLSDRVYTGQSLADVDPGEPERRVFSRRVMETLARDLETARDIAYGINSPLRSTDTDLLSVLESLEDMTEPEDLRSVELSFQWATAIPHPNVGTEPIKLEHSALPSLSEISRPAATRPQIDLPRRVTLVGPVRSLTRNRADEVYGESGEAVVWADVRGRSRNVHIRLSGRDHELVIQAYRSNLPITVSGDLVFERQRWRLVGDMEIAVGFQ